MALDLNLRPTEDVPDLNEANEEEAVVEGEEEAAVEGEEDDGAVQGEEDDGDVHPFDLNLEPHEDDEYFDQGTFRNMDDELDAMQAAVQALEVDIEDEGVYGGDVHVPLDEEDQHDSDPVEPAPVENEEFKAQDNVQHRKELTGIQRSHIYQEMLLRSHGGTPGKKTTIEVADILNVSIHQVRGVWRRVKQCRQLGILVDVSSRKPKRVGRKRITHDLSLVQTIPLNDRGTVRRLGIALGIKKSTMHKIFKNGLLRRHSNTLKPYLKEDNKKDRLRHCLDMLDDQSLPNEPVFKDMRNIIHLDEKWFNTTKKNRKFYMLPEEDDPNRTVHNKNSIDKIMFVCGITRPRYDAEGICTFDGKFGIWPFVKKEPAPRNSHNRPRGTLITKCIAVNRNIVRCFLIEKLLPAIQEKWPADSREETIWIQQDNAPSHMPIDDPEFLNAVAQTGLDIRLMNQPANSPDMNILDLGLFASLQSLTDRLVSRNIDEMIANVQKEYDDYDAAKINRVFLTLQSCLIEVMKCNGGNGYKIPHMNKEGLELLGILPNVLSCERHLFESVLQALES